MANNIYGTVTPKKNILGEVFRAENVGGTKDYNKLSNHPSIEGVELVGDKTFVQLGLRPLTTAEIDALIGADSPAGGGDGNNG